ncbi:MAG: DEAD/DEAH box helicase, partial [Oscillospiraceae bacterium]
MSFENLSIISPILKALQEEGYTEPSPIQQQAITPILEGNDLLGCAKTGTGKTAAFGIPMLQLLSEKKIDVKAKRAIRSLILTPTRELALQISESLKTYGRYLDLKTM